MVLLSLRANAMQGLSHIRTTESRSNTRIGCRTRGDSGGGAVEQSPIQNINISAASHQPSRGSRANIPFNPQSCFAVFGPATSRLVYCSTVAAADCFTIQNTEYPGWCKVDAGYCHVL